MAQSDEVSIRVVVCIGSVRLQPDLFILCKRRSSSGPGLQQHFVMHVVRGLACLLEGSICDHAKLMCNGFVIDDAAGAPMIDTCFRNEVEHDGIEVGSRACE